MRKRGTCHFGEEGSSEGISFICQSKRAIFQWNCVDHFYGKQGGGECNVKCKDDIKNLNKELLLFLSKFGEALIGGHDLLLRRDIGEFTKYSRIFLLEIKILHFCYVYMYILTSS